MIHDELESIDGCFGRWHDSAEQQAALEQIDRIGAKTVFEEAAQLVEERLRKCFENLKAANVAPVDVPEEAQRMIANVVCLWQMLTNAAHVAEKFEHIENSEGSTVN